MKLAAVSLAFLLLALSSTSRTGPVSAFVIPSLTLNPASGSAPSVSGSFSGSDWVCSGGSVPAGSVSVSGTGVTGSGTLIAVRGGSILSGNFTATGSPGQSITITVTTSGTCPAIGPPIHISVSATFTFNQATPTPSPVPPTFTPTPAVLPTWTPTAATLPTWTPTPAAAPPAPGPPAPPPPGAPSGPSPTPAPATGEQVPPPVLESTSGSITFEGCTPAKDEIELELTPLFLAGEEPSGEPTGAAFVVPANKKPGEPSAYEFQVQGVEAGRVFGLTNKTSDAGCAKAGRGQTWMAGKGIVLEVPLPGNTALEGCRLIDKSPCEDVVVKGASVRRGSPIQETASAAPKGAWVLELTYFPGDLKSRNQRFRWDIDLTGVRDIELQASVLPFPKTKEADYMSPPGLVASWPVHFDTDCGNCEFLVPLKALDPTPDKGKAVLDKVVHVAAAPFKAVGGVIGGLFGGGKKKTDTFKASKPQITANKPSDYLVGGMTNPLLQPTTFYFRVVPFKGGAIAGAPSNTVVLQETEKPPPVKFPPTVTPVPIDLAYELKILSYNGIIPPLSPNKNCYVVTQEAWPLAPFGLTFTIDPSNPHLNPSVKPGQLICEPTPDEPSIFEVIFSWAETTLNWASGAWQDLKSFAVQVALKYTPLGQECSAAENAGAIPAGSCQQAMAVALDAALASMGIPPDIPNFDQLMDQGIEYLAAETAAQVGIPPEVVQQATEAGGPYAGLALDAAEAKLRAELQAQLEAQMKDAVTQIQLGYAKKVGFVPDGIPVRPDDYQPPGMTVRVTRKAGVAGGDAGCSFAVRDSVKLPAAVLSNPPPEWANAINGLPFPKLSATTAYDFFINEADLASGTPAGLDKSLTVPPLAPGDHFDIPMTFKPNWYKSGFSPLGTIPTDTYILAWQIMHEFGDVTITANGTCGADTLTTPAKAILLGQEVAQ